MQLAFVGVPYTLRGNELVASLAWHTWQTGGLVDLLAPFAERALWVSLPEIDASLDQEAQRKAGLQQLRETVHAVHSTGTTPILLGGDSRLVALGTLAGLQQSEQRLGIAWFDAHGQLGPEEALKTALEPAGSSQAVEFGIRYPVPPYHVLIAGVRDARTPNLKPMDETAMMVWEAEDLNEGGASELGRDMKGWPPILLQIDLRVLDPEIMPNVRQPAAKGLSLTTLAASLEGVMAGGRVIAVGISNYCPEQDVSNLGLASSAKVVQEAVRILTI
jgi:arginase